MSIIDDGDAGFASTSGFLSYSGQGYGNDVKYADIPSRVIIDNVDAGFSPGAFTSYSGQGHGNSVHFIEAGESPYEQASWRASGLVAGPYLLSTTWTPHENRADNAPYLASETRLSGTSVLLDEAVNQKISPVGFTEQGTVFKRLNEGSPITLVGDLGAANIKVELSNNANGYVIADAVLLEYLDVASWTFSVAPGDYKVSVTWSEHANRATNAPFSIYDGSATSTPLSTTLVNQRNAPADFTQGGVNWHRLNNGNAVTITGNSLVVRLTNNNADGFVIADAVLEEAFTQ